MNPPEHATKEQPLERENDAAAGRLGSQGIGKIMSLLTAEWNNKRKKRRSDPECRIKKGKSDTGQEWNEWKEKSIVNQNKPSMKITT